MQPLRIVHCANFSETKNGAVYYATDRKISNGLIRNGHFVYDFSYRDVARNASLLRSKKFGSKAMNQALHETVGNVQPDLLLLGHSELVDDEALRLLKQQYPHMRLAMWWVDWIYNLRHIEPRLQLLDSFFITTAPSELAGLVSDASVLDKCFYLPNICDESIDTGRAFERDAYDYDVLFVGRYDEQRQPLIDYLHAEFSDCKLGVFGLDKNSLVLGNDYLQRLSAARIGINYNRNNKLGRYSSDRLIQLAANGVLVMSPEIPDMREIFSDDELVYFADLQQLGDKIRYYLEHDHGRREIAQNGWRKAHVFYNETRVTQTMLQQIFASRN
ncbi:MAG: glycosyltransferase [Chromatiales bacterium]|jgi:glycosyltransferase involved in cell wall biosynthesis